MQEKKSETVQNLIANKLCKEKSFINKERLQQKC